jgi:hypothetical protein
MSELAWAHVFPSWLRKAEFGPQEPPSPSKGGIETGQQVRDLDRFENPIWASRTHGSRTAPRPGHRHGISYFFSGKLTPQTSFHLTCRMAGRKENARPEDRVGGSAHSGKVKAAFRVA